MRKYIFIIVALLAVHVILLGIFAAFRIADADEGVYLNATRMVHQGMTPYTDFFYTQLSMMPTLFAAFGGGGWESFFILRSFAVIAGLLSALLFTVIVLKQTQDLKVTVIALFFYSLSGMFICWHSTYKALPFCHLLTLAAFFFWYRYYEARNVLSLILSGLFLSALINFRSVFIVLLPVYLISVTMLSDKRRPVMLGFYMISLLVFAVPTLVRILDSTRHFFYGNLMFQLYRAGDRGLGAIISNRLEVIFRALIDPQILIILLLTLISIWLIHKQRILRTARDLFTKPEGMVLLNLVLIWAVYMLPHPMSRQYIGQYLAFTLLLTAFNYEGINNLFIKILGDSTKRKLAYVAALVYIMMLIPYTVIFVFGIRDTDTRYKLSSIREVTSDMLVHAGGRDTVLSEWPGYTFITGQTPLRYTEIIGHDFNLPLEHEEYLRYNLCDRKYLYDEVARKAPALLVNVYNPPEYYAGALEENYELTMQSDVVSVYKRR